MRAIHKKPNPTYEEEANKLYEIWSSSFYNICSASEYINKHMPEGITPYIISAGEIVQEDFKEFTCVILDDSGIYHKYPLSEIQVIRDMGEVSDGYHTFNELYEFRLLYNAAFFNLLYRGDYCDVYKSKLHSDGEIPFGDPNWFIVVAELPEGQISNHYEMKDWDLFKIPEKHQAGRYDGHTPQDVAKRLRRTVERMYTGERGELPSALGLRVNEQGFMH